MPINKDKRKKRRYFRGLILKGSGDERFVVVARIGRSQVKVINVAGKLALLQLSETQRMEALNEPIETEAS